MADIRGNATSRKPASGMDLTAWIWLGAGSLVAVFTVIYVV